MQGGSTGIGYGLKYQVILFEFSETHKTWDEEMRIWIEFDLLQARCISDVKADTDHTSFLTGTLSLKEENEVVFIFNRVVIFKI